MHFCVIHLHYNSITVTQNDRKMKAKKSSPKSIRFNINDFDIAMQKGKFESAQEMVDILLKNYVQEGGFEIKSRQQVTNITKVIAKTEKELSKGEMLKLIKEGKI